MKETLLTADWRKLIMVNYALDPEFLRGCVPAGTQPDIWNGRSYVSLVGFMFTNTKLLNCSIPFHNNFEEVNLRFYVNNTSGKIHKRGVVFIKEFVPKSAVTWVANTLYGEKYETVKMDHQWKLQGSCLEVQYRWEKQLWNSIKVTAANSLRDIMHGTEEEFITEHYWGYAMKKDGSTVEYEVEHERWRSYPVHKYAIDVDFGITYGKQFQFLNSIKPSSVFLVEGSAIAVKRPMNLVVN